MKHQALHIVIPPEIMSLPDLTVSERILLAQIAQDSRSTNTTLAEVVGLTRRGAESMLRRLRERSYIEAYRKGRARQLFLMCHVEHYTKCGVPSASEPHVNSAKDQIALVDASIPSPAN